MLLENEYVAQRRHLMRCKTAERVENERDFLISVCSADVFRKWFMSEKD
jgi:hypothetical protein